MEFMKERRKMRISKFLNKWVALCVIAMTMTNVISAQEGQVVDKIIAKVDENIILKSELEKAYINFLSSQQARTFDGDARCLILRSFVEGKVMLAMAEIDSTTVADSRVDYELQGRMQRVIQQYGSEKAILQAFGKTIDQFMDELRPSVEEQLLIKEQEDFILADVKVTPSEIKKFFKSIPSDSLPLYSREYEAGMIVKSPVANKAAKQKVIDRLLEARDKLINQGGNFDLVALDYSEGPTKTTGGNLGFQPRGTMDPAYEAAALALKVGEYSMPVESSFGIHLIQLLGRRGNEYDSRHIIIVPKPSSQDMLDAKNSLDSLRKAINAGNISFEEAAKQFSDDESTKLNGGYINGPSGSNRIPADNMDPELFFALDSLKVGEISEPSFLQLGPNNTVTRILYFKKEIPPHKANLKDDYEKLKNATTQMKRTEKRNEYLEQKILEVYIEIDPEYNRCGIINDN